MTQTCPVCASTFSEGSTCPVCGYKLAGQTQKFAPVSLPGQTSVAARAPKGVSTLTVIRGPQIQTRYTLAAESKIGRSPHCDILLNDMTVSREHAVVTRDDHGFYIRDTNSYNGLWINNTAVDGAYLQEGDVVQIGAFCLIFHQSKA